MSNQLILVADSDPKNLQILKENLEASGFQVITVADGTKAWEEVHKTNPNLVLTEINLPELNGFQLLEKTQADPNTSSIPLIFLTNQREVQQRVQSFQMGAKDYLVKPLHVKEVIAHIRMVLRRIEKKQGEQPDQYTKFSGRLSEISLADLIENFSVERRTGVLTVNNNNNKTGHIYFHEGTVVNADLGDIRLENAIYQMLPWKNGYFNMVLKDVNTPDEISISNLGLLLEGVKRMERREELLKQFPSPKTAFTVTQTFQNIIEKKKLPDDVKKFVSLLDGKRSIVKILDESCYDDFKTLERLIRLYKQGFIEPTIRPEETEPLVTVEEVQPEIKKIIEERKPVERLPKIEPPPIEKAVKKPPTPPEIPDIPIPIQERIKKQSTKIIIPKEEEPKIAQEFEPTMEETVAPSFDHEAFLKKQTQPTDMNEWQRTPPIGKLTDLEVSTPYTLKQIAKNQLLAIGIDEDSLDEVMDILTDNTFQTKTFEMLGDLSVHIGKIAHDEFNFIKLLGVFINKPINQLINALTKDLIGIVFIIDCTKDEVWDYASYLIHSTRDNFQIPYVITITNYQERNNVSLDVIRYKLNLAEEVEILFWNPEDKSSIQKILYPLTIKKDETSSPKVVEEEPVESAAL